MAIGMKKKNFLLYDFMQVVGGAERVTLTLAKALPDFETVVSRCYPQAQTLLDKTSVEVHELKGGGVCLFAKNS